MKQNASPGNPVQAGSPGSLFSKQWLSNELKPLYTLEPVMSRVWPIPEVPQGIFPTVLIQSTYLLLCWVGVHCDIYKSSIMYQIYYS
jgi:hypothetical protein